MKLSRSKYILLAGTTLIITSCSREPGDDEIRALAGTYSELLILENLYAAEPERLKRATDSLLSATGYKKKEDVIREITDLAAHPPQLKAMLDSVDAFLGREQGGSESARPIKMSTP